MLSVIFILAFGSHNPGDNHQDQDYHYNQGNLPEPHF